MISIITDYGPKIGNGHIQRMLTLADYLNHRGHETTIVCKQPLEIPNINFSTKLRESELIIRDKRDSTADEIIKLKKFGPVVTIDDIGSGRSIADHYLYILPNTYMNRYNRDIFLYGYNFIISLEDCMNYIQKSIDVAIYISNFTKYKKLLMPNLTYALMFGHETLIYCNGKYEKCELSHAEILLSSKILVTHFGITLFEGYLAKCKLFIVNPTSYLSYLSHIAIHDIPFFDFGLWKSLDYNGVQQAIIDNKEEIEAVDSISVQKTIENCLDNFYFQLLSYEILNK